jgi:uncharacterized membrane protein YphA (DoxX/SURF4 family)
MSNFFSNKYLLFFLRILLGSLFIYSAVTKIFDTSYFVKSIENYKLLPSESLNIIAMIIPALELIVGVFLLLGVFVKESALVGSILMIIFILAVATALVRGLDIDCGCFGTAGGSRVGVLKLFENFLILAGYLWLTKTGSDFLAVIKDNVETRRIFPF